MHHHQQQLVVRCFQRLTAFTSVTCTDRINCNGPPGTQCLVNSPQACAKLRSVSHCGTGPVAQAWLKPPSQSVLIIMLSETFLLVQLCQDNEGGMQGCLSPCLCGPNITELGLSLTKCLWVCLLGSSSQLIQLLLCRCNGLLPGTVHTHTHSIAQHSTAEHVCSCKPCNPCKSTPVLSVSYYLVRCDLVQALVTPPKELGPPELGLEDPIPGLAGLDGQA